MDFFGKRSEPQHLSAGIIGADLTASTPQRSDLALAPPCECRGNSAVLADLGTTPFNAFLIARYNDRAQRPRIDGSARGLRSPYSLARRTRASLRPVTVRCSSLLERAPLTLPKLTQPLATHLSAPSRQLIISTKEALRS
jgi:hypothetical protein